jgi:transcriptional regulator with XRE-family HTH domain
MNNRIKEARKRLLLTQKDVGEKLGFTDNYIYMMECGKKAVSERYIHGLVTEYGINENWIRTGEGDMFMPSTKEEEIADIASKIFKEESLFRTELIKALCDVPVELLPEIKTFMEYVVDRNKQKKNEQE